MTKLQLVAMVLIALNLAQSLWRRNLLAVVGWFVALLQAARP